MSYGNQGSSNRQLYDPCAYKQYLDQSVDPLYYEMYFGKEENCHKCIDKKAWYKQDVPIVNIESELLNITRPLSDCSNWKYNPNCKTSSRCISTFDPNAPKIMSPSLCPIVYNNIPIQTDVGYRLPNDLNMCRSANQYTDIDSMRRQENNNDATMNVFINSCSNQPLYNGAIKNVKTYNMAGVTNSYAPATLSMNSLFAMFGNDNA